MGKAKSEKSRTLKLIAGFFAAVMLIQGLIYVISANSHEMFRQINSEAEQNLYNSALKQSVLLKNKLCGFSDMSDEVTDANAVLSDILDKRGISSDAFLSDPGAQDMFIEKYAGELIDYMAECSPSGVFVLLCGDSDFLTNATYRGLFIKDADPDSADDFDTVMTRGSRSVSVHYNIPLDINWASDFEFSKSDAPKYRFFIEPVTAARKDPSL